MSRPPTVLLFDVDGTLVSTGGAGRRALETAFARVVSRTDALGFTFAGMTDRAIVRRGLCAAGASDSEATIDTVLEAYLEVLAVEVVVARDRHRVMPGIHAILARAAASARTSVGLGTGNIERGARLKLAPVGLDEAFAFGGFGSDAEDRAELLRIGAARGAARLGATLAQCRVVVVGDTPLDVAAARAIGAECVAVATGSFGVVSLRESGATDTFADLSCEDAMRAVLGAP